jgi:competence protein ComEC
VALIRRGEAVAEDCAAADLVVSPVPVRSPCRAVARVVDRIDVWRSGAHAIWLAPGAIRVESVDGWRGDRPWVPRRDPPRERPRGNRTARAPA